MPRSRDPVRAPTPYTVVSAYAGAGGLDLGFRDAGFEFLWAIDSDRDAVETYRANLGDHIVLGELPKDPLPATLKPDVVIGGPPCQGFSVAGRMDPDDPRSEHVFHFLDVVELYGPSAFCMENVRHLGKSERWADIRHKVLQRARQLEYQVEMMVLNAADYGVPQARERMFLVGVRGVSPLCPVPSTSGDPRTVRQALNDLPPYGQPGNSTRCTARIVPAPRPVMRPSPYRGSLLFNGPGRVIALDAPARTLPASMGGNATPIIDQLELEADAPPWIVGYHSRLLAGRTPNKSAPARMRRLTVEEAAALQTFPTAWRFIGTAGSCFRQIGNAVPPTLGFVVARSIHDALDAVSMSKRRRSRRLATAA